MKENKTSSGRVQLKQHFNDRLDWNLFDIAPPATIKRHKYHFILIASRSVLCVLGSALLFSKEI